MAVEPQVQQFIDFIRDEMPRRIKTNPNDLPDAEKLLVSVSGTLEVIYKTLAELDIAIKSDVDAELSNKEPTITAGSSTQYIRGDKTLATLNADAVPETVSRVYLSPAQKTIATQAATSTLNGYLSSADWTTFNGKQAALADVITANTYGNSTQWPIVTVNAKGIVTGVTLQTVPTPYTDAMVRATDLAGISLAVGGVISATDTVLGAFGKLQKQVTDGTGRQGATNTAFGLAAQPVSVTGTNNTAFGANAQSVLTTGSYNTAFGIGAQLVMTTGSSNTAIGRESQVALTTGTQNVSVGERTHYSLTTGTKNIAVGMLTHYSLVAGTYNIALGYHAGFLHASGDCNIFIGMSAGHDVTSGSNNTIIGSYKGVGALSDNVVLATGGAVAGTVVAQHNATDWEMKGALFQNVVVGATKTLTANSQLVVEATSNSLLTFKLKGTDGVTRTATLTLV